MKIDYIDFPGIQSGVNLAHVVTWDYSIGESDEVTGGVLSMRSGRDIHLSAQEAVLFKQELADRERLADMQESAENN